MTFNVRATDLDALNSLTKYPSIPTYHALGDRGSLTEEATAFTGPVIGTEKIDGTNARVISLPDGTWLLGSREELLCAKGDLIGNPAQGIVAALRGLADRLNPFIDSIMVYYLEVYGGKVTAASKQYTGDRVVGHRLFDIVVIPDDEAETLLAKPQAEISSWREHGGQPFLAEPDLAWMASKEGLDLAPRLFTLDAAELPREVDKTLAFLAERLPQTLSALDDSAGGKPEGIVLRTADRNVIAKARFEDYNRTLRRRSRNSPT
ncbi:RNA ligase family protein [Saccharopolyspora shandongensis]|uniref:RNA ligase family protein n=1 Tax=Saccharopolyspora shandongensis TaxID=418495 RepID=UPI0033CF0691